MSSFTERVRYSPATKELLSIGSWWTGELRRLMTDLRAKFPQKKQDDLRILYSLGDADSAADPATGEDIPVVTPNIDGWHSLQVGNDTDQKPISVLIPLSACLIRTSNYLNVPPSELRNIIELELVTTTPFSPANAAWSWRQRTDGTTDVIIIKRELIERIRTNASEAGLALKDIRPETIDTKSPAFEKFETPDKKRARFWRKADLGLTVAVIVLLTVLYGVSYSQKAEALSSLQSQITTSTAQARELRAQLNRKEALADAATQLQALKNDRTSIVETWARITSLLPTSAWVSELMLDRNGGTIIGFTDSAASLIGLLEEDPSLQGVTFATAIRIDPLSKAERFDIRFTHEFAE